MSLSHRCLKLTLLVISIILCLSLGGSMFALFNYSNKFAMTVMIIALIGLILDVLIIRNIILLIISLCIYIHAKHKGYFISEITLP